MPPVTLELQFVWRAIAVLLVAGITLGSLAPLSFGVAQFGLDIPNIDKLQHTLAYALLTAWYMAVFPSKKRIFIVPLFALGLGVLMEGLQSMTGYREPSFADILADAAGILAAAIFLVRPLELALIKIEKNLGLKPTSPTRSTRRRRTFRHRALWEIIGAHLAAILLVFQVFPSETYRIDIPYFREVLHFVSYGGIIAWFMIVVRNRDIKTMVLLAVPLFSTTLLFFRQLQTNGGELNILVLFADTLGILISAFLIYAPLKNLLISIEQSLPKLKSRIKKQL